MGSSDGDFHASVEDHYRAVCYEGLDLVTMGITDRFDQPGYKVHRNIEGLILKACQGKQCEEELDFVCTHYKDDVNKYQLQSQLPLLQLLVNDKLRSEENELSIRFIANTLSELSTAQRGAFSQVFVVMKLLLVMPATNTTSERSFSALRRVKTYLRSSMGQMRLNNLMVLHVHKQDLMDILDFCNVGNEFVGGKEVRMRIILYCKFIKTKILIIIQTVWLR